MLDLSTATLVTSLNGQPYTGELTQEHPSALYKVELTKPGRIVANLSGLTGDADIILRSPDGDIVATGMVDRYVSMNPGNANEYLDTAEVGFPDAPKSSKLHKGTYALEVALKQGQTDTKYKLTLAAAPDSPINLDAGTLTNVAVYRGVIDNKRNVNSYTFTIDTKGTYINFVVASASDALVPSLVDSKGTVTDIPEDKNSPVAAYQLTKELEPGQYTIKLKSSKKGIRYIVGMQKLPDVPAAGQVAPAEDSATAVPTDAKVEAAS